MENKLFETGKIGRLLIKNRSVLVSMGTNYAASDGTVTERMIRYYEERARGGVGLIITEYCGVDEENSRAGEHDLRITKDSHIAMMEQLTETVHRYGCYILAQLHHGGATSNALLTGKQPISAGTVPVVKGGNEPHMMTVEEIKAVQKKFVEAALRCQKAGFDGVELHGAHAYLIHQFMSPYFNQRTDMYGGNFENRMRFITEIIAEIRKKVKPAFVISVRISADEMTPEIPGTLTVQDSIQIAQYLEKTGIDVLNVSYGNKMNGNAVCEPYFYQPGWKKHIAKEIKKNVLIPVIAANTVKFPHFAEKLLEEGVCDFVGLGRSLLADPEFMNKFRDNRTAEIRNCIGCMVCRERAILNGLPLACTVNPRTGREYLLDHYKKDGQGKPVAVLGGGPGGMQAALALRQRGYRVTLFEKKEKLGGTMNLACIPYAKNLIGDLNRSMQKQLEASGVEVRTSCEVTLEQLKMEKYKGVILATGARPIVPRIPGIDRDNVVTAEAVISGQIQPKGNIVVVGTGLTGLETAEMLGSRGCKLTLIEMQENIGPGLYFVILDGMIKQLEPYQPKMYTGQKLIEITDDGVKVEAVGSKKITEISADWIVLSLGVTPDQGIRAQFENGKNVSFVGDASKPGRIYDAMLDGFGKALTFSEW